MRLISFAALSFLAITVSALPGPGTPHQSTTTQSALQHQSTDTPGAYQHQDDADLNAQQLQSALLESFQQKKNDADLNAQQLQSALLESLKQHKEDAKRSSQQKKNDDDPDDKDLQKAIAESLKQHKEDANRNKQQDQSAAGSVLQDHFQQSLDALHRQLDELNEKHKEKKNMADGMYGFIKLIEKELAELLKLIKQFTEGPVKERLLKKYRDDSKTLKETREAMHVLEAEIKEVSEKYTTTMKKVALMSE
ncbi:hypothetical protein BASA50_001297 [Batrachochytrium salamandrivorans]|uniref:Uncharacterized protein n=1 Tax=Batrachochytrium salamandrivorans TaxID=1357716 RepID=A0ABQ8EW78_9FUNG|nr:hypothetical protein BASA50_001297 [Batrachochytrium salamandrivorans]